jgi:hypothetical protein
MSKPIFAAVLAMAAAAPLAAPAHARIDAGPISSLYENDGRASARPQRVQKQRASKAYAKKRYGKKQSRGTRTASYGKRQGAVGRKARLAARAVTASHSGGGGGGASRSCLQAPAAALLARIEQQFGPVKVISTCRPGAVIAGSGKPSKHRYGLAVDFDAGARKQAIVNWLRANHTAGGTMTYARMSHIHVDIGPRFVSLGAGGGRRRG